MIYGAQRWTLTKQTIIKLDIIQGAMEGSLTGITLRDKTKKNLIKYRDRPWTGKRYRGRPTTRWYGGLKKVTGLQWISIVKDCDWWKKLIDAYDQYWAQ